jgi:hypothetical protein
MAEPRDIDGVLVQWGDRLFYPPNRIVKSGSQPRLKGFGSSRAAVLRERIAATVRRAPQVMVKVTGGGRGMKAIAAHFRYVCKNGRLEIEDERGQVSCGKDEVRELVEDWRLGGSRIDDVSYRREAFNVMLSMPRGTDPLTVQRAAREFAKAELADHKYVMVLHDHQANPHVHLSVRAESMHGKRLNPRKADLQRWRETFAERLREWGVDAEATRRATRFQARGDLPLWRIKAREEGRERQRPAAATAGARPTFERAREAWTEIERALATSPDQKDRALTADIARYLGKSPAERSELSRTHEVQRAREAEPQSRTSHR